MYVGFFSSLTGNLFQICVKDFGSITCSTFAHNCKLPCACTTKEYEENRQITYSRAFLFQFIIDDFLFLLEISIGK